MKNNLRNLFALLVASLSLVPGFGQASLTAGYWQKIAEKDIPVTGERLIIPTEYLVFKLDIATISQQLNNARRKTDPAYTPVFIQLPKADGTAGIYQVFEGTTMDEALAAKYPGIRSFDGIAQDGSGEVVKFDLTHKGFHAMILSPKGPAMFIDPYSFGTNDVAYYIVYSRDHFETTKVFNCNVVASADLTQHSNGNMLKTFGDCNLRTYRLALSATGEYTAFQGGTVADAMAAQVTTMTRVNGVYERELSIHLVIIANNDLLIYTNKTTDPFTNGNPDKMINENQATATSVIGSANFDIGHVFGTNSGGLASLGVVCSNAGKASGVTGSAAPIGDAFDIDYVCHEMGHQFRANHTQNNDNCNRNNATAVEPGSGSTIMGYAGVCAPNVQNHSDDFFHGTSLNEIGTFITSSMHTCPVQTPLSNSKPLISTVTATTIIPAGTPFALTGAATDPDGDVLTYSWEQTDKEVSTQPPVATATKGPNFKAFPPTTNPTRYFPGIASQVSGIKPTWEVLPTVDRTMHFQLVVRDNAAGGGCNESVKYNLTPTSAAGPFVVQYPSAAGITWAANSTKTITWSVANTDLAPISCSQVDILISLDGGATFTQLANNTPNDGSQLITVPGTASTQAVIMVISDNGFFFDVSNNKFTISTATCLPPDIPVIAGTPEFCPGDSTLLSIGEGQLNGATAWHWYASSCGGTPIKTGTSVYIKAADFYYVRAEGGCISTPGNCKSTSVTQTTVNTNVVLVGGILKSGQTTGSWQWVDCSNGNAPIPGATNQAFLPDQDGNYAVIATSVNGCENISSCFNYISAGLNETAAVNVQLYPNPTNGLLTVAFGETVHVSEMTVTDIAGRLVRKQSGFTAETMQLDLSGEGKGIYFLDIQVGSTIKTLKITRQ